MGFTLPARITAAAVRSYRTFSPLPGRDLHPHRAVLFSVALSVKLDFNESPRPLAGMLPCGDRTFLPAPVEGPKAAARPAGPKPLWGWYAIGATGSGDHSPESVV